MVLAFELRIAVSFCCVSSLLSIHVVHALKVRIQCIFILMLYDCLLYSKTIIFMHRKFDFVLTSKVGVSTTLREILLVLLTQRSQLFIFSKQYQKCCKTYQFSKVYGTKDATSFFVKLIKFI